MDPVNEGTKELKLEAVLAGDRPAIAMLGMVAGAALKKDRLAVFMVDSLGRVLIMAPSAVEILQKPRVPHADLDKVEIDRAIEALLAEGETDAGIMSYLTQRERQR